MLNGLVSSFHSVFQSNTTYIFYKEKTLKFGIVTAFLAQVCDKDSWSDYLSTLTCGAARSITK